MSRTVEPHGVPKGISTTSWLVAFALIVHGAAALPSFDFTTPAGRDGWVATHDVAGLEATADGVRAVLSGSDPYFTGPAREYPSDTELWLHLRLKSDTGGMGQVFYFKDAASEARAVSFPVPAAEWHDAMLPVPALGPGCRLRIDPPGDRGSCVFSALRFEARPRIPAPAWPRPERARVTQDATGVRTGGLSVRHAGGEWGRFEVLFEDRVLAQGNTRTRIGYWDGTEARWFGVDSASGARVALERDGDGFRVRAEVVDPGGAEWRLEQRFQRGSAGSVEVDTRVTTNRDRDALYLPALMLLAGMAEDPARPHQALFAGIEYLENEPSSSEADVTGPAAWRLAPASFKITFPLMAVQSEGAYVGLVWEPAPGVCAVFDAPDRQFGSGGRLMGVVVPGSDGVNRDARSLVASRPQRLTAGVPVRVRSWILAGAGQSIVPALEQYVRVRGLPELPSTGLDAAGYARLAARGWLDSRIREGDRYRHAHWPGFHAQPAADAAMWMRWLASQPVDGALSSRLITASVGALALVEPGNYNAARVGHHSSPGPSLVFGGVEANVASARALGRTLRARFGPDGSLPYAAPPGGIDYGRTHGSREANGYAATTLASLLEAAVFSGDAGLIQDGLRLLRGLDRYTHTVPRGAQTWEIPLHTPDILASAHLVRCYLWGYELTGEAAFLERARYWAWTGVPFVYLARPGPGAVGVYSTTPVLGATAWVAPVWIGLPVQWCGLVYGEAIARLAIHDPEGPWDRLSRGIAAAGIQHTWPEGTEEKQGLLPDLFHLDAQRRDGPPINPATLLPGAARLHGLPQTCDFRAFRARGMLVFASGRISGVEDSAARTAFTVEAWSPSPSWVLLHGVASTAAVKVNGTETRLGAPHQFHAADRRLTLRVQGRTRIEID